jgi:SAM-dependent methyltransferase
MTNSTAHPPFRCPECGAPVVVGDKRLTCDRGHTVGTSEHGLLDFRRARTGVDAELAEFWATNPEYYAIAGALNASYGDDSPHMKLIDLLVEARVGSVIDVGAGTGEFGAALAQRRPGVGYVGIDVSPIAVERAMQLGRPGMFIAADAERLPFADGAFDAAISLYALEHFADPRRALEEMARVVRPGGTVAVFSISYDRPWGTIPSVRFGRAERGRILGRWSPLNLIVYSANRLRFGARQLVKQIRFGVDPTYMVFETVDRPIVLEGRYEADLDAVHVVSGRSALRVLRAAGLDIVRSTVRDRPLAGFAVPFALEIVARKRAPGSVSSSPDEAGRVPPA